MALFFALLALFTTFVTAQMGRGKIQTGGAGAGGARGALAAAAGGLALHGAVLVRGGAVQQPVENK
jgi:hypothetical protein